MKLVLIAPSGAVASALDQLDIDLKRDEIIVVARTRSDADGVTSVILTPTWQSLTARTDGFLGASVIGRNIQRLTPLDRGRRFASAARRNANARNHSATADLIIVLERDGLLTGWRMAHHWAPSHTRAVYGVAPAQAVIAESRA